jgi:hypothetical protein
VLRQDLRNHPVECIEKSLVDVERRSKRENVTANTSGEYNPSTPEKAARYRKGATGATLEGNAHHQPASAHIDDTHPRRAIAQRSAPA